jgi:peptidase E
MAKGQQIVALGGGGFSMEDNPVLDDFVLTLASARRPRICFLPTASGDSDNYIVRFYKRFTTLDCIPSHLELFRRNVDDIDRLVRVQDVIYVGGGNSANMLAVWKLHGVDLSLRNAFANGTVLAGISAGSLCWFDSGVTDSFGSTLAPIAGLGLLTGSNCPFYDGLATRRPSYHRLIREGMAPGIAADIGVALHYVDGELKRAVSSRLNAKAYRVALADGDVRETEIEPEYLRLDDAG